MMRKLCSKKFSSLQPYTHRQQQHFVPAGRKLTIISVAKSIEKFNFAPGRVIKQFAYSSNICIHSHAEDEKIPVHCSECLHLLRGQLLYWKSAQSQRVMYRKSVSRSSSVDAYRPNAMERCLYAATACVLASGLFLPPPVPQLDLPRLPSVPGVPGLPTLPGLSAASPAASRPTKPYVPSLFQIILHKIGLLEPLRRKHKSLNRMKEMYLYGPENAFRPSNRPRRPPVRPLTLAPPRPTMVMLPPEVATPSPVFATPQAPEVPDEVMYFDDVDYFSYQDGTNSPAYDYAQVFAQIGLPVVVLAK